jgi:acetolactate synthase-1/2/3 large subunit
VKKMNIPVLTTWKALDLFEEEDPLFIGRPGAVGQRAANIAQQKSDWLLMLGARMDMGQTAYMHKYLAREAKKIMVDIDENEINKMETTIDVPITCDADAFIDEMLIHLKNTEINNSEFEGWRKQCREWKDSFPVILPEYWKYEDGVSIYALVEAISTVMSSGDLFVPGSSGACSEVSMQAFKSKKDVRVFNSEGLGPMGFGISSAIGGCIAAGGTKTVCIDGDGGFAMNTQELETVSRLNLPIIFFVLDNNGYASIRSTQKAYFEGRYYGSTKEGGLTLPKLERIASAYGIQFMEINTSNEIRNKVEEIIKLHRPIICRVKISKKQVTSPRITSRQTKDGNMETAPMEEMWSPT